MEYLAVINRDKKKIPEWLRKELENLGKVVYVRGRIENILERESYDAVVAVGGDGTHSAVINYAIDNNTPVVLVAWGSGGDFAKALGIENKSEKDARKVLRSLREGTFREGRFDVLEFESDAGKRYSTVGVHIGLFAATINMSAGWKRAVKSVLKGKAYIPLGILTLLTYKEVPGEIHVNGRRIYKGRITTVHIANSPYTAAGALVSPESRIDDGRFEFMIANIRKYEGAILAEKMKKGEHIGERGIHYITGARWGKIILERPADIGYDGEYFGKTEKVKVKIKEKAARILLPT